MMPVNEFLSLLGLGLALVALGLLLMPIGCSQCPHCIADKKRRKDESMKREHLLIGHICHERCPLYNSRPGR